MAETKDGKGTTKLKTADQHNAARRAAKAKQRRNRHRGGQVGGGFTAAPKATPVLDQSTRAKTQADEARRIIIAKNLTPGSLAYRVAMDILDRFPYAKSDGKKSKTSVAVGAACRRLTAAEKKRQKAVRLGINSARAALLEAGNLLYNNGHVYRSESASR